MLAALKMLRSLPLTIYEKVQVIKRLLANG